MEPELVTHGPISVIGYGVRTKNADEGDPAKGKIGPLWGRFMKERLWERIPGRTGSRILAVYTDYESDHRGLYTLVVGAEVARVPSLAEGQSGVSIPHARYARFTARGEMPRALIETWGRIWEHCGPRAPLARAYTTDFEVHDPADPSRVDIHIAVK